MKKWRVIFTGTHDAFFNMALDEALLFSCERLNSPPILRLYQWNPPGISLGYSQLVDRTVDVKKCRDQQIDVVRRITGGRAVLHENELTYSVCASIPDSPELGLSTLQTYQKISLALLESLRFLGIEGEWVKPSRETESFSFQSISAKPCFVSTSRYEITVRGKKLIGSAQRRFSSRSDQLTKESFIQHGSILIGKGWYNLAEFLPEGNSKEMMRRSLEERSTNLEELLKRRVQLTEMISVLKAGFKTVFNARMEDSSISGEEQEVAENLKEKKYHSEEWSFRR